MEEKKNPNQTPEISDEELDRVAGGEAFDRVCILCGQGEQVSAGLCQSCLNKQMAAKEKKLLTPSPGRFGL